MRNEELSIDCCFFRSDARYAARNLVSLDCESRSNSFSELTLKVRTYWTSEDKTKAVMRDITMAVADAGYRGETETGRAHTIDSDAKYKPRKYKNHIRFDMNQLTNVDTFGRYYPDDSCAISVLTSNDVVTSNVSKVEVPVILNCEQSGGVQTLDCKVGTVR